MWPGGSIVAKACFFDWLFWGYPKGVVAQPPKEHIYSGYGKFLGSVISVEL
jgi:hypothetical protein